MGDLRANLQRERSLAIMPGFGVKEGRRLSDLATSLS
jgi:hypothetical protein